MPRRLSDEPRTTEARQSAALPAGRQVPARHRQKPARDQRQIRARCTTVAIS